MTGAQISAFRRKFSAHGVFFSLSGMYIGIPHAHGKITVVVSKKISRSAVVRNRIKRRTIDVFSSHGVIPGLLIMLYPKKEVVSAPFLELRRDAEHILTHVYHQ